MMLTRNRWNIVFHLLVNADNAIDVAHAERCPLPFLILYGG